MNKIEQLLNTHAKNEVEYVELGNTDFFNVIMGQSPDGKTVSDDRSGTEFHQGKTNFTGFIIESSGVYTSQPTKIARANSVLMSVRAPVGAINYTDREICIGRGLCSIQTTEKVESMFLYYIMQIYGQKLADKSTGSTFASTNTDNVKAISIPLPPLPVQREIVRILDTFTALEAELEARRKQYEYYRNQLLSFEKCQDGGGGRLGGLRWGRCVSLRQIFDGRKRMANVFNTLIYHRLTGIFTVLLKRNPSQKIMRQAERNGLYKRMM